MRSSVIYTLTAVFGILICAKIHSYIEDIVQKTNDERIVWSKMDINTTSIDENNICRSFYTSTDFQIINIRKVIKQRNHPIYVDINDVRVPFGGHDETWYEKFVTFHSNFDINKASNFKYSCDTYDVKYFDRIDLMYYLSRYPTFNIYQYNFDANYYEVYESKNYSPLYLYGKFDGENCVYLLATNKLDLMLNQFCWV